MAFVTMSCRHHRRRQDCGVSSETHASSMRTDFARVCEVLSTGTRGELEAIIDESHENRGQVSFNELPLLAIEMGSLDALKILVRRGAILSPECVRAATRAQNFSILFYLQDRGIEGFNDSLSAAQAAVDGRVECLQHFFKSSIDEYTTMFACRGGHLRCLKYAHEQGADVRANAAILAAGGGYLNCLKYVTENAGLGEALGANEVTRVAMAAVHHGDLDMLQYVCKMFVHFRFDAEFCVAAAANGDVLALKLLVDLGCPIDERAEAAARSGSTAGHESCLDFIQTRDLDVYPPSRTISPRSTVIIAASSIAGVAAFGVVCFAVGSNRGRCA